MLLARAGGLEGFARHVVIKRLRPEVATEVKLAHAFLEEARIAGSLHHQNIVTVHDIGEQDGAYFFAMEYVHGEDARKLITKVRERGEHIPLEHALSIVMATAAGLHHAHEQTLPSGERLGLVHRDIAPANILIGYDGSVKIVDFGMAKAVARSTQTMTGLLKGKASYMSPEQCTGKPIDRRTDVFALGIVLFELITAQRLFKGANDFMTMAAIVEGEIPRPSTLRREVPPALDAIIMRALERSPESRYQTAESMRESLEAFALANELRTSHKSLADYLTGLFGHRLEPWETQAKDTPLEEHDEDGTNAKGLVAAPPRPRELLARLAPRAESPMMQADADADDDGEWGDDDENVRTEAVGRTLAASRGPRAETENRTQPSPNLPAAMKDGPFGGSTVTSATATGQTIVDTTVTRPGVDVTVPSASSPDDTGQMPSKVIAAAARAGRGEEIESRTVVEPPIFEAGLEAQVPRTEDFVDEAATEAMTGDEPVWKQMEARAAATPRKSPAIVPRASLAKRPSAPAVDDNDASGAMAPPSASAAAPSSPRLPVPPSPNAAAPSSPRLPFPPSANAAAPSSPRLPIPPPANAAAPSSPRLPPPRRTPPPTSPPPVEPAAAPSPPVAAVAPAIDLAATMPDKASQPSVFSMTPAPLPADLNVRGWAHAFVVKHQNRIWIAGGVALVLLVILASRGCGNEHSSVELNRGHEAQHEGT